MKLQISAILLTAILFAAVITAAGPGQAASVPVLLELFTSESCSSCPPADRLLETLDRQPVANAELIVVSEHVDYWNDLGWRDPNSSVVFTARQQDYSHRLATDLYTPQLVIDGYLQATGSDKTEVLQTIALAARKPKLILSVHATPGNAGLIHVEASGAAVRANLYIIVAAGHAESEVLHGENSGQKLTHVAVAQSVTKIGKWTGMAGQDVPGKNARAGDTRVIAILADPATGKVLGAAQTRF